MHLPRQPAGQLASWGKKQNERPRCTVKGRPSQVGYAARYPSASRRRHALRIAQRRPCRRHRRFRLHRFACGGSAAEARLHRSRLPHRRSQRRKDRAPAGPGQRRRPRQAAHLRRRSVRRRQLRQAAGGLLRRAARRFAAWLRRALPAAAGLRRRRRRHRQPAGLGEEGWHRQALRLHQFLRRHRPPGAERLRVHGGRLGQRRSPGRRQLERAEHRQERRRGLRDGQGGHRAAGEPRRRGGRPLRCGFSVPVRGARPAAGQDRKAWVPGSTTPASAVRRCASWT